MPQSDDDDSLVGNGEESQVHCKSIDDIYSLYECFFLMVYWVLVSFEAEQC